MSSTSKRARQVPTKRGAIEGIRYYAATLVRTERGRWAITISLLVSVIDVQMRGSIATWAGEFQIHVAIGMSVVAAGFLLFVLDLVDEATGRWDDRVGGLAADDGDELAAAARDLEQQLLDADAIQDPADVTIVYEDGEFRAYDRAMDLVDARRGDLDAE